MKRFLAFLVSLGLLALLIEADFYAYFADVESVSSNTLQAGTVNIELGHAAWIGEPEPIMDPGDSVALSIPVKNIGSLPSTVDVSVKGKGNLMEVVQDLITISPPTFYLEVGATVDIVVEFALPSDLDPHYEGKGGTLFVIARASNENFFDEERTKGYAFSSRIEPPEVEIIFPREGAHVAGWVHTLAQASDNFVIDHVVFYVDGQKIGKRSHTPYAYVWDARHADAGEHVITVEVYDSVGGKATDSVRVQLKRHFHGDDLKTEPQP